MTVTELGRNAKAKYPDEFGHLSDADAGRKVKNESPKDYWDVIDTEEVVKAIGGALVQIAQEYQKDTELDVFSSNSLSHLPSIDYRGQKRDLERTVSELNNYYKPNLGRLSSWNRRSKAESRTKLSEALTNETISVLQRGALLEEAALRSEKGRLEFQKFVATHTVELLELKSHAYLFQEAIQKGLDKDSVVEINRTRYLNETDLEYKERMLELDIKKERQLSQIKLEDYEGKKKADNESEREYKY